MKETIIKFRYVFGALALTCIPIAIFLYFEIVVVGWFSFIIDNLPREASGVMIFIIPLTPLFIFTSLAVKGFEWNKTKNNNLLYEQGVPVAKNSYKFGVALVVRLILWSLLFIFMLNLLFADSTITCSINSIFGWGCDRDPQEQTIR